MLCGRSNFPFSLEMFCLFFERFLEMRPNFICQPTRSRTHVQMNMWGKMISKRGQPEFSARISTDALGLLASEVDYMFVRGWIN